MRQLIKAAGAVALAVALSTPAVAADKLKVGFIYVGPVGDFGYSYQHDQGRLAVEKALGDKVETTFLENVPKAPMPSAPSSSLPAPATSSSSPPRSASWSRR